MPQHRGAWYTIPDNMSMETYIFAQEWRVEGSPPGKRLTDDDVGARLGLEPRRRRVGRMPRGRWGHEGWPGTISLPCRSMADSPLRAQRKSCYLAEGIEETTALVAAERDHDLLVYYFIVVHQSAEPGREADVAHGGTDRPTPPIPAKPMAQERTTLSTISRPSPKTKQNQRLLLPPKSCHRKTSIQSIKRTRCTAMCQNVWY